MATNQHDLLIVYTSKNGRTGAMVDPILIATCPYVSVYHKRRTGIPRCALIVDSLMGYVAILACVQRTLAQSRRLLSLDQRSDLSSC